MHALLVTTGTAGNVLPFVGLGEALRARGHDVTLIASGAGTEAAGRAQLGFVELDGPDARSLPGVDGAAARKAGVFRTFAAHAVRHMRRVYELVAERHVPGETVVVAPGWLFGARLAREKLGVPLATVHLQPLMFGSGRDTAGLPRWTPRWVPRVANAVVRRVGDWAMAEPIDAFRTELGLPPAPRPVMPWWSSPDLVIGFFPEWYAARQPDWPGHTLLGDFPLYDLPHADVPPDLDAFLADGDPPLVFSQAWLIRDAHRYFEASVAVARELGRRAVLLTPHAGQIPGDLPPGVRHFGFVPLSVLLPRAAAVVHHGGMGTIGQALAAAVPQLTVPALLDQFDNSRRLLRLGVSANVPATAYRPRRAARRLRELLESPEVGERCRYYAGRVREEKPFENACRALERLHRSGPAATPTRNARCGTEAARGGYCLPKA